MGDCQVPNGQTTASARVWASGTSYTGSHKCQSSLQTSIGEDKALAQAFLALTPPSGLQPVGTCSQRSLFMRSLRRFYLILRYSRARDRSQRQAPRRPSCSHYPSSRPPLARSFERACQYILGLFNHGSRQQEAVSKLLESPGRLPVSRSNCRWKGPKTLPEVAVSSLGAL